MPSIIFTRHDESCDIEVYYKVTGKERMATMEEPAEYPELEWWVDDDTEFTDKEIIDIEDDCWKQHSKMESDMLNQKTSSRYDARNDM